jgi:hypothetical protein
MKKVIFKFSGGPLDGTTVSGEPGKDAEVRRYYVLTHHGRLGQRFRTASQYAVDALAADAPQGESPRLFQQHVYEVVDRIDNRQVLLLRIAYVQKAGT